MEVTFKARSVGSVGCTAVGVFRKHRLSVGRHPRGRTKDLDQRLREGSALDANPRLIHFAMPDDVRTPMGRCAEPTDLPGGGKKEMGREGRLFIQK